MLIRRERSSDIAAIAAVHASAFVTDDGTEPVEVGLVGRLRADPGWIPALSMVAEADGAVIGHICLTRAAVDEVPVLALGPVGVLGNIQGSGVGSALTHAALGAADALDEPLVGLLGHLDFYPRFGFVPARKRGIRPSEATWASHFQVRTLAQYDAAIAGVFQYAPPFYEL